MPIDESGRGREIIVTRQNAGSPSNAALLPGGSYLPAAISCAPVTVACGKLAFISFPHEPG